MTERSDIQEIRRIFELARSRPVGERAAVVEAATGNEEIRSQVRKLLEAMDSGFLEDGAVAEVAREVLDDSETTLIIKGQYLDANGRYRIESRLGKGGMGEVFLATDTKLGRKVAVKRLPRALAEDSDRIERFKREAKTLAALNHPYLVTILENGVSARGERFIATEYIDGETLRDLLNKKNYPLALDQTLKIAIQTAEALLAAHEAGIVHRDVKPENIMIRRDGYVKVLDFGLAKLTGPVELKTENNEAVQTQSGMVIGTASYMSPEQAKGQKVDNRSDIFSLGVVIYEMVKGEKPFSGETVSHTIVAILETEPEPIENVPEELQQIIRKALEKDREDRYQSSRELVVELKRLRREIESGRELERSVDPDRTVPAREKELAVLSADSEGPTRTTDTVKTVNAPGLKFLANGGGRLKAVAILSATVFVVSVISTVYRVYFAVAEKEIASIAVLPFENTSGDPEIEYLPDGMTETLINSLSGIPNLHVKSRSSVFRYKRKELEPKKIAAELNVEAVLMGQFFQREDQLTLNLELIDAKTENVLWGRKYVRKSSELASLQTEITGDVADKLRIRLSGVDKQKVTKEYTADAEAYRLYLRGVFFRGKLAGDFLTRGDDLKRSIEEYKKALEKDPNYALAYAGMASSYVVFSEFGVETSPKESLPMAKAAAMKAIEIDPTLAEPHTVLGLYHRFYSWDLEAADKELRMAIELDPDYATAHHWLGLNLAFQARFDEAIREMERAGELDPLSRIVREQRGYVLFLARRYDAAIKHIKDTQALLGEVQAVWWSLGRIYLAKGQYKEAIAELRGSLRSGDGSAMRSLLACALARAGQRNEAFRMLDVLEREWKVLPEWHAQWMRAFVYTALGDTDRAFFWLNRMFSTRSNVTRILSSPELDDLRKDPRFEDLKRRIALAKMS